MTPVPLILLCVLLITLTACSYVEQLEEVEFNKTNIQEKEVTILNRSEGYIGSGAVFNNYSIGFLNRSYTNYITISGEYVDYIVVKKPSNYTCRITSTAQIYNISCKPNSNEVKHDN